jgi:hypothetical protein
VKTVSGFLKAANGDFLRSSLDATEEERHSRPLFLFADNPQGPQLLWFAGLIS